MVKIVGRDESVVKRITCKHCASILEYTQNEVKINRWTDYGGGHAGCEFIECPSCHKQVIMRSW